MNNSPSLQLVSVFVTSLGINESEVAGSHYRVTPGWDSVAHMGLVALLETTFGIMLETDDVIALSSFDMAKQILSRYGVEFEV
jgi:acyl carrier protein